MMGSGKPVEHKRDFLRMNPAVKMAGATATSPDLPHAGHGPVENECVSFSASRRSGNIAVEVTSGRGHADPEIAGRIQRPEPYRPATGDAMLRAAAVLPSRFPAEKRVDPARGVNVAAMSLPSSLPRAAAPVAFESHDEDTPTCGARQPSAAELGLIANMMDQKHPEADASASASPSPTMHRARIDPQLARIIDAWPGLPSATREAMVAALDGVRLSGQSACHVDDAAEPAPRARSASAKKPVAVTSQEPPKRRTRKTADPS